MLGILVSFWDGLFSGAKTLVSGRVQLITNGCVCHQGSTMPLCCWRMVWLEFLCWWLRRWESDGNWERLEPGNSASLWPFWDGEFTWPFKWLERWPPNRGSKGQEFIHLEWGFLVVFIQFLFFSGFVWVIFIHHIFWEIIIFRTIFSGCFFCFQVVFGWWFFSRSFLGGFLGGFLAGFLGDFFQG